MLKSFHILNYRNLKSVSVDGLEQVNLLVGLNNVGKTSFLEAINLYTSKNPLSALDNILRRRGNGSESSLRNTLREEKLDAALDILSSFFYKKLPQIYENEGIILYDSLADKFTFTLTQQIDTQQLKLEIDDSENLKDINKYGIALNISDKYKFYPFKNFPFFSNLITNLSGDTQSTFVASTNSSYQNLGTYWDKNIYLTDKEFNVIEALQIIEPNIEKIGFKGDRNRTVEVKLKGDRQLYSLNDMGDGMNRILSIIISIIYAENNTLLIDEFENGLHYTAQYQLWKMIFSLALKLNVQVFASTHSSDCISAFENVLNNGYSEKGKVLRLENKKGQIVIQTFDSREMGIVTQNDVEIR